MQLPSLSAAVQYTLTRLRSCTCTAGTELQAGIGQTGW